MNKTPITVAHGDGIGPEIMDATLQILEASGAALDIETIEIGEKVYLRGNTRGYRTERVGVAAANQGVPQGAHHHPAGRRLQEPQRHHAKDAGPVRQRAAVRLLPPVHRHQASEHGRGDRPRERRGPLRRHRVPAEPGSDVVHQADLAAGQREDRALRVRVRAAPQPQEGHLLHERQHHEDDRRSVPQGLRRDRARSIPTSRKRPGSSISAPPRWPTRRKPST